METMTSNFTTNASLACQKQKGEESANPPYDAIE